MSVLALSLWAALQDDRVRPAILSADLVISASTEDLAKAVLPPEIAAKVKGHQLGSPQLHWIEGYPVRFWGDATSVAPGFCQRETYYVPMPQRAKGWLTPGSPTSGAQIKMAVDCSTAPEPFVYLNYTSPKKAAELLRWFTEVHQTARVDSELNVDLECRSELQPNPCLRGARKVLAELPLDGIYIIGRDPRRKHEQELQISIKPKDAPNLYWQLDIFSWSSDRPRVRINWAIIPPL